MKLLCYGKYLNQKLNMINENAGDNVFVSNNRGQNDSEVLCNDADLCTFFEEEVLDEFEATICKYQFLCVVRVFF